MTKIRDTQKTTKLGTSLTFEILRKDGTKTPLFLTKAKGRIFRIISESSGWRLDVAGMGGLIWEAADNNPFPSPDEAARALATRA